MSAFYIGDYDYDIEMAEIDFSQRINKTVDIFKAAMAGASRELIKYNPSEHKEGKLRFKCLT